MSRFKITHAAPIDGRLLIAIAGPQASGKTTSALRLAAGVVKASGGKICLIDTENKRALRYASDFNFNHMPFDPPFDPLSYLAAIDEATAAGYGEGDVIIIDSMSHEHEGPGGVLEMHEKFLQEKAGNDFSRREKLKFTAWIKPKADRTRVITMGLQRSRAHIILCFRAKEKVKMVQSGGKTQVINNGWQPIGGDEYFYEMDITMILPQGAQGKPDWSENASRINEYGDGPLKRMLHGTQQLSESTGEQIYTLSKAKAPAQPAAAKPELTEEQKALAALHEELKGVSSQEQLYAFLGSERVKVVMVHLSLEQIEWWEKQKKAAEERISQAAA